MSDCSLEPAPSLFGMQTPSLHLSKRKVSTLIINVIVSPASVGLGFWVTSHDALDTFLNLPACLCYYDCYLFYVSLLCLDSWLLCLSASLSRPLRHPTSWDRWPSVMKLVLPDVCGDLKTHSFFGQEIELKCCFFLSLFFEEFPLCPAMDMQAIKGARCLSLKNTK